MSYIENPKTKGSGIICCIPQPGRCPNNCDDCFFQSGRSYLEPLEENTPNIPTQEQAKGHIVRVCDGNDANNQRGLAECTARDFDDYYFNTSVPDRIGEYSGPVILTVNPGILTDATFFRLRSIPDNLMFVRVRVNMWNLELVRKVIQYYTKEPRPVDVVLTWMTYYKVVIPDDYKKFYDYRKHIINESWCIHPDIKQWTERWLMEQPHVYNCGSRHSNLCKDCGNCLRAYYATKERVKL